MSDEQIVSEPSCIGLNEERGIGLCTYSLGCGPEHILLDPENFSLFFEEMGLDEPVSCLAFVRGGVVDEWGWITSLAGCRAYRDLYPCSVDCMDYDWTSEP